MKHDAARSYRRRFYTGWGVLWAIDLVILAAGFLLVRRFRFLPSSGTWALEAAAVMVYQQLFLLCNRKKILSGENLDHLWGPANILSLLRGTMIAVLAGFLFAPKPTGIIGWLPALLYTLLATLDFFDGYWARRSNTATRMGELLDQEYDALGILVAVILVVQWGHLPPVFLCIGAARYVFAWALAWRTLRGRPVYPLAPSYMRRRLAGFQMGILAVFLWPIARPPGTLLAELIIGVPLLLGFIRDWLQASGALDLEDPVYRRLRDAACLVRGTWLPLIIRVVLAVAAAAIGVSALRGTTLPAAWMAEMVRRPGTFAAACTTLRLLLLAVLIAGRWTSPAALLLLLLEAPRIFLGRLDPLEAVIVTAALLLYLFGPGRRRLRLRFPVRPSSDPEGS
ncbi:MAG: CDP-alcohol phosphatidyltransferase family protein [Spirochaetales bacterium]|nr:CDP-alcohol phosphatidyltransferase family protein [Spirochaetales bacterium]